MMLGNCMKIQILVSIRFWWNAATLFSVSALFMAAFMLQQPSLVASTENILCLGLHKKSLPALNIEFYRQQ